MADKRRRDPGDDTDDDDDDVVVEEDDRDSLDLDAETEEKRLQEIARVHDALIRREDMLDEVIASLRNPTVIRTVQMMLNLGLLTTSNEVGLALQLGMRDIEEKERQEAERRRNHRPWEEEGASRRPPSPPIPIPARPSIPSPEFQERNRYEFDLNMDAMRLGRDEEKKAGFFFGSSSRSQGENGEVKDFAALASRSQEEFAAGRASFAFGNSDNMINLNNASNPAADDVDDVEEVSEEKKAEQARLLSQIQGLRSNSSSSSSFGGFAAMRDPDVVDLTGDSGEEKKQEPAQRFSLFEPPRNNPPRHPTILQRLDEAKAREEKNAAAGPSPLSRINVSAGLPGLSSSFSSSSSSAAVDSKQHPLYQDLINSDRSIADRIRAHFNRNQSVEPRAEAKAAEPRAEEPYYHSNGDFEWDDVVPPSPIPEEVSDDDDESSSSSSSSEDVDAE